MTEKRPGAKKKLGAKIIKAGQNPPENGLTVAMTHSVSCSMTGYVCKMAHKSKKKTKKKKNHTFALCFSRPCKKHKPNTWPARIYYPLLILPHFWQGKTMKHSTLGKLQFLTCSKVAPGPNSNASAKPLRISGNLVSECR